MTVIGKLPVTVGVPERTPFDASVRPDGSVPLASENVAVPMAPACVKVWLNGDPAGPLETTGLTTVMTLQQTGSAGSPAGSEGAAGGKGPGGVGGERAGGGAAGGDGGRGGGG